MRTLGLDTSTWKASVGLRLDGETVAEKSRAADGSHAVSLLSLIEEVLRDGSCTVRDLDAVAVSGGPGSFTGLRIGLSVAKGLVMAQQIALRIHSDRRGRKVVACGQSHEASYLIAASGGHNRPLVPQIQRGPPALPQVHSSHLPHPAPLRRRPRRAPPGFLPLPTFRHEVSRFRYRRCRSARHCRARRR